MMRTKPCLYNMKITTLLWLNPRVGFGLNVKKRKKGRERVGTEPHCNRWDHLPGETGSR